MCNSVAIFFIIVAIVAAAIILGVAFWSSRSCRRRCSSARVSDSCESSGTLASPSRGTWLAPESLRPKQPMKLNSHMKKYSGSQKGRALRPMSGNYGFTAAQAAAFYHFPTSAPKTLPTIAIISLGGSYQMSDLNYYWQTVNGSPTCSVSTVSVDGAKYTFGMDSGADGENALDIEIASGACPGGAKIVFYSAPNTTNGFYDAFNRAILDNPNVISCSWGGPESTWSSVDLTRFNALFKTAMSLGIPICCASGDSGSGDGTSVPMCDFPASSPYVISCGGTTIVGPGNETLWAWNPAQQWGEGAGLSRTFPQQAWQIGLVKLPPGAPTSLNSWINNRSSPDVVLNADPNSGYTIYVGGQLYMNSFGGTSCAAPLMAAYLASLGKRITVSSLYSAWKSNSSCFRGITIGSNDSLGSADPNTYVATAGFDIASGLGSIADGGALAIALGASSSPPTHTATATSTATATFTETCTAVDVVSETATATCTYVVTATETTIVTNTHTQSATATQTATHTITQTNTITST